MVLRSAFSRYVLISMRAGVWLLGPRPAWTPVMLIFLVAIVK